jgi:RNA ligase (TIGR02306 family)
MEEISKLNTRPEFEFLRGVKFHIKTRRILSEISQGICFPLSILNNTLAKILSNYPNKLLINGNHFDIEENLDLTELLGVIQYIAPDPAVMGGDAAGTLTGVGLLISDEERLENLNSKYEDMRLFQYYKTEKLDGTSFTAYLKNGMFGVCGRTVDFQVPEEDDPFEGLNSYWKTAIRLNIEEKMRTIRFTICHGWDGITNKLDNIAIQGELIGEGIQGNIYKLKGQTVRFYNAFYIDTQEYMPFDLFVKLIEALGLETVPILDENYTLPENAIDLLKEADVTYSVLNPAQLIEGFVYVARGTMPVGVRITRAQFNRLSFKAKSRVFDMNKK